ncbi:hypothetical protein [Chengkuizengella axinellae]|uniref:Uncharacterized protein n=1 Tax=Chengkuizengella axinellae TaxID=3064388 RepID=A0ABT9J4K7_9BACL|nr:hypothetical protein [Chengkuizengella sp. 2205SS18-9]MDP5276548.1 hypothetical protein [Chengkuizengella sp. 2205SS18-9]
MSKVFYAQTNNPRIDLPQTGENRVILNLVIPDCYKYHNSFKIDGFFELNFLLGGTEILQQDAAFKMNLNYQLLDGIGDNCKELTPQLRETISGSILNTVQNNNVESIAFESNTTPNLTVVTEGIQESLYMIASVQESQGGIILPGVQFRALNATAVSIIK